MLKEKLEELVPFVKSHFWFKRYKNFILSFGGIHDGKFERHHVLPKAYFKEYEKSPWNLIKLSYRAHYLAHYILAKACGKKFWYAFHAMNTLNKKPNQKLNSIIFANARNQITEKMSEINSFKNLTKDQIKIKIKAIKKSHKAPNRGKNISKSLNKICENGKTIAQNRAIKAGKTSKTKICENGLTQSQNIAFKTAKILKERNHYENLGKKLAYNLTLFDKNGKEVKKFLSKKIFWKWCEENDIPKNPLYKTFENNSFYNPKGKNKFKKKSEKVIGWYLRKTT